MTPWKQRRLTPSQVEALVLGKTPKIQVVDALRDRELVRAATRQWCPARRAHEWVLDRTPLGQQLAEWHRRMQWLEEGLRRSNAGRSRRAA